MRIFKKHIKTGVTEMTPVTQSDINLGPEKLREQGISISPEDLKNGSPKIGDMIARNPDSHTDLWLVANQYYRENYTILNPNQT